MKAALINSYGTPDVFEIHSEIKIPEPLEDEVLIHVKAASVNPVDWKLRKGAIKFLSGFSFPKILGYDVAGEVAGIGNRVEHFRVGDAVFGMLQSFNQGSYAQFTVAKQNNLVSMPKNLSFEQCAAVPLAGLTAFQGLTIGGIDDEKRVLVLGGSGGVGSLAIQIAKAYGCKVAATAGPRNQLFLRELGADSVLDYSSQTLQELEGPFDLILDCAGKQSFSVCRPFLAKKGVFVTTMPSTANFGAFLMSPVRSQKCKTFVTDSNYRDLLILKKLLEKEQIRPIIDRVYPLEQIREAHLYAETKHVRGKIVISITD